MTGRTFPILESAVINEVKITIPGNPVSNGGVAEGEV